MEKIKKIELINYDGHSVETLKFNPPLLLFSDEVLIPDFTTQAEYTKSGVVLNLQFEIEESSYEIYDVDDRTSKLLDVIKYGLDESSDVNIFKLEEKIQKAFLIIMQPTGDSRFDEDYDDYDN